MNRNKLILELLSTTKELINTIADAQIRIERLEGDSHPPVDWEEIIFSNTQRIDYLERKIFERDSE